jgi:transposase-like protein
MSILIDIFQEKCPKCSKGHAFYKKGNPLLFQMPRMHTNCPVCGHKFEKETGYFFGSMYVSYALTVAEMVAVFLIAQLFSPSFIVAIISIAVMAVMLSTFNFRLSRMLWIYMLDGKGSNI